MRAQILESNSVYSALTRENIYPKVFEKVERNPHCSTHRLIPCMYMVWTIPLSIIKFRQRWVKGIQKLSIVDNVLSFVAILCTLVNRKDLVDLQV